jgi:hypothetical protein
MSKDNGTAVTTLKRLGDEENGPNKKRCTKDGNTPSNGERTPQPTNSSTPNDPPSLDIKEPPIIYWLGDGEQSKSRQVHFGRSLTLL